MRNKTQLNGSMSHVDRPHLIRSVLEMWKIRELLYPS